MKKTLSAAVAMICLFALCLSLGGAAYAKTAELKSTQAFIDFLEQKEIKYYLTGSTNGREEVDVTFDLDHFPSLTCELYFKDDEEEVSLRIWNLVKASAGKNYICTVLNSLNDDYKFVKFVFDESDSTVQEELDVYIDAETCGRAVYDSMMALFQIADNDDVAKLLHSLE